jgi:hypothetical protein
MKIVLIYNLNQMNGGGFMAEKRFLDAAQIHSPASR